MNALIYLFFVKIKAMIRNIFSKKASLIFTGIGILSFVGLIFLMLEARKSPAVNMMVQVQSIHGYLTMFSGYVLFFMSIMVFQKRMAVVTSNDANYIFAGPFSRQLILGYLLVETIEGSLLYAFFSAVYMLFIMVGVPMSVTFIVLLILGSFLMFYFVFGAITFFYFWEMDSSIAKKVKLGFMIAILTLIGILLLISVANANWQVEAGLTQFMQDPIFYLIPVIGWVKYGLIAVVEGNVLGVLLGFGASFGVCAIITWLTVNIKGDFYEQAIQDAEWVTELKERTKKDSTDPQGNRKIKEIKSVQFREGAGAIRSKNLLIMNKTNGWVTKQTLLLTALYLLIAYINGRDFTFYQFFILIVVMTSVTSDSMMKELKTPYIYLIPDKPIQKLINLVIPQILKIMVMLIIALAPCLLLFEVGILDLAAAYIQNLGFALVFIASSLWSVRILKTSTGVVAEQYIKMLMMIIAALPSLLVQVVLLLAFGQSLMITAFLSSLINLLMGILLIYSCRSILAGANVMAD